MSTDSSPQRSVKEDSFSGALAALSEALRTSPADEVATSRALDEALRTLIEESPAPDGVRLGAVAEEPEAARTLILYASSQGLTELALEVWGKLENSLPDEETLCLRAEVLSQAGRFEEALADTERALALAPESEVALRVRADLWSNQANDLEAQDKSEEADDAYRRAVEDYSAVLELSPGRATVHIARAQARAEVDEFEAALDDYAEALKLEPDSVSAHNSRGILHEQIGEFAKALADYEEVVRLAPESPLGWRNRADAHLALGDADLARADYSEAIERSPEFVEAYLGRVRAAVEEGDFEDALEDVEQALRISPDEMMAVLIRGDVRKLQGGAVLDDEKYEAAETAYRLAIEDYSTVLEKLADFTAVYLSRAEAYAEMGDYRAAERDCDRALDLEPESVAAHNLRGILHERLGDFAEALEDYEEVVRLAPEDPFGWRNRADMHLALGNADSARADYSEAVRLFPEFTEAYLGRAGAAMAQGEFGEALVDANEALRIERSDTAALLLRGDLHRLQGGDFQDDEDATSAEAAYRLAVADYTEVLAASPELAEVYLSRAEVFAEMGDEEAAQRDYDRAIELEPYSAKAHNLRGLFFEQRRHYDDARRDHSRAIELFPGFVEAYLGRARAVRAQGDLEQALKDVDEALRVALDERAARLLRAELRVEQAEALEEDGRPELAREASLQAIEDYDVLLETTPDDPALLIGRADARLALDEIHRALWDYDQALARDPEAPTAYRGRALANLLICRTYVDWATAEEGFAYALASVDDADRALEFGLGTDPRVHGYRGSALHALEDFEGAVASFDRALELGRDSDPESVGDVAYERGLALLDWGKASGEKSKVEEAVAALEEYADGLSDEVEAADVWATIGAARIELDGLEEALAAVDQALGMDPENANAALYRGTVLFFQGRFADAAEEFQKTLDHSDDTYTCQIAKVGLGLAAVSGDDPQAAERAFTEALELEGGEPAFLSRAQAFEEFRAFDRAEADLRRAVDRSPSATALNQLAWFLVERQPAVDSLFEAVVLARRAVEEEGDGPDRGGLLDTLGWAVSLTGDPHEAVELLEEASELIPYDHGTRRHLRLAREAVAGARTASGGEDGTRRGGAVLDDGLTQAELIALIEDENTPESELEAYFEFDEETLPSDAPETRLENLIDIPNLSTAHEGVMGAFNRRSRKKRLKRFLKKRESGFEGLTIVSEGDSWFQFPVRLRDVVDHLSQREDWNILSLGAAGDWLSNIRLREEYLEAIDRYQPGVFLISGGGNDLVGKQRLKWLLRRFTSGKPAGYYLGTEVDRAIEQLEEVTTELVDQLATRFPKLWILGHGYDRALPNDGKWLGKPMSEIGIEDPELQREIAARLIDRFNEMRLRVSERYDRVRHVDCRGLITHWHDELHPKSRDFGKVAERFAAAIDEVTS